MSALYAVDELKQKEDELPQLSTEPTVVYSVVRERKHEIRLPQTFCLSKQEATCLRPFFSYFYMSNYHNSGHYPSSCLLFKNKTR
jgi:hypothetical protein